MKIDSMEWYHKLQIMARDIGVSVADKDAWLEDWEAGKSPEDSLSGEYPDEMKEYLPTKE